MGKSGIGVVLIASTELALATENRFRIHPKISSNIANRIHDVIGEIDSSTVHLIFIFDVRTFWAQLLGSVLSADLAANVARMKGI